MPVTVLCPRGIVVASCQKTSLHMCSLSGLKDLDRVRHSALVNIKHCWRCRCTRWPHILSKLPNLKAKLHCQFLGDADICKYLSGLMDDAWRFFLSNLKLLYKYMHFAENICPGNVVHNRWFKINEILSSVVGVKPLKFTAVHQSRRKSVLSLVHLQVKSGNSQITQM